MGRKMRNFDLRTAVPAGAFMYFLDLLESNAKKRDCRITIENYLASIGLTQIDEDLNAAEANIASLLSDMIAAQYDIAELQGEVGVIPGKMEMFAGSILPSGYIWARGETIGNAGSGATYAGDIYKDLYDMFNVNGLYGNDGAAVWGDGDTVLAPDMRNITPYGANESTRDISGITHPATPLGVTHNDRLQGHDHKLWAMDSGDSNIRPLGDQLGMGGGTDTTPSYQNVVGTRRFMSGYAEDDASNGTPRTGNTTMAAGIGVNYIIKY